MTKIEPTIENGQPGDVVTIEKGTPGKAGHRSMTVKWNKSFIRYHMDNGWRITRITRPAPPIPTTPGERFWAVGSIAPKPREYLVTDARAVVALDLGMQWDLADFPYTVVPAPEPETVPVPADLIRESEEWNDARMRQTTGGASILARIVRAVREWEGES